MVRRRRRDARSASIGSLALVILAPIAATLIQLSISRQREYSADATGAQISGNPESLASALLRLEEGARRSRCRSTRRPSRSTSSSRSRGKGIAGLFCTHPPIEERVKRLRQMRPALG